MNLGSLKDVIATKNIFDVNEAHRETSSALVSPDLYFRFLQSSQNFNSFFLRFPTSVSSISEPGISSHDS